MEQFSLEKYLENPSRKVVTRLKKSAQIISIEGKEDIPIVALVEGVAHQYKPNGYHADVVVAYSNQCRDMGDYDIFFADEEELTEFEKAIKLFVDNNEKRFKNGYVPTITDIKTWAEETLRFARKEILKDLPKWKNVLNDKDFYLHEKLEDYFVKDTLHPNGCVKERWVLKKSDLDKLPKEE